MDSKLIEKEKELELLKVDKDIATEKAEIAQRKAVAREMKKTYGPDWKKIIGLLPKANRDSVHDMYSVNPELKELSIPRRVGR